MASLVHDTSPSKSSASSLPLRHASTGKRDSPDWAATASQEPSSSSESPPPAASGNRPPTAATKRAPFVFK
jgi:hypothetical protein